MKKITRRTLVFQVLPAVGIPAVLGAACSSAPSATGGAKGPASGPATVELWHAFPTALLGTLSQLIKDFESKHPNIKVRATQYPVAEITTKALASVAAGAPPDVYTQGIAVLPDLVVQKALAPIDDFGPLPTPLYPGFDDLTKFDGKRYGVPANGGISAMFYNPARFKAAGLDPARPPATWDELRTYAKKMSDPAAKSFGVIVPGAPVAWTTIMWYGFLLQAGGQFLSPDRKTAVFNSEAGVQALQFWLDLVNVDRSAPLTDLNSETMMSTYSTGNIGIMPHYAGVLGAVKGYSFESMSAPLPAGKQRGAHLAGQFWSVFEGGKNKAAAGEFVRWWAAPENTALWCASGGGMPTSEAASKHQRYQDYLKNEPLVKGFQDSVPHAVGIPNVVGISGIQLRLAEAIQSALFGKASPKEALDRAAAQTNALLK